MASRNEFCRHLLWVDNHQIRASGNNLNPFLLQGAAVHLKWLQQPKIAVNVLRHAACLPIDAVFA